MIVFVVGVGRSGTSLLQSMIAAHPSVAALPETSFLRRFVFGKIRDKSAVDGDKHLQRLPELLEEVNKNTYDNTGYLKAYKSMLSSQEKAFVLDKDPRLVEFIPLLLRFFGADCRIIHIYRDPRDVLASKKKAAWSSGRSLFSYAVASTVQLEMGALHEHDPRVLSLSYEELISGPKAHLERISDFIGLPFDEAMLDHTSAARKLVNESEKAWKTETFKPVNSTNHGKWVNELSRTEAAVIENASLWAMNTGGYRGTYGGLDLLAKLYVQAYGAVVSVASSVYRVRHSRYINKIKSMVVLDEEN